MENPETEKENQTQTPQDPGNTEVAALKDNLRQAVAAFRESLIKLNPDVPPDMIGGETLGEVTDSLFSAKKVLGKLRKIMEAEKVAAKVPAGLSTRSDADLSSLSAREKIQHGIGGK
jgi:hypothetical protein